MSRFRASTLPATVAILGLALCFGPLPASAQYLYLDSNGDGIRTDADVYNPAPLGTTNVDVWLVTNANRDGSPAACVTQDGELTINSYEFILHARRGTVAYSGFVNHQPDFTTSFGEVKSSIDYHNGLGGGTILPPGTYHLASLVITTTSGTPFIDVAPTTPLSGGFLTSFGSQCSGNDFDNTMKLGSEWTDADGLAYGAPVPDPPVIEPIANMSVNEGAVATQTVTATDADGDPLTFSKSAGPAFMTVSTIDPGAGTATGEIQLAPGTPSAGSYTGEVKVADPIFDTRRTFGIQVIHIRPPVVLDLIPDIVLAQHADSTVAIHATSADAAFIYFNVVQGPDFAYAYPDDNQGNGFLFLGPYQNSHVGEWDVRVAAYDGVTADSQTVHVTVTPNPQPPVLYVYDNQLIAQLEEATINAEAYDPDADEILSIEVDPSGLPPGDVITPLSVAGSFGEFHWTPTQIGTFTLRFTAEDATHAQTTFERTFQVHSRPPLITAPAQLFTTPLRTVSFTASVSDPDGDPITTLAMQSGASNPAAVITIAPDHSSATFTWTPSEAAASRSSIRTYAVSISASDGGLTRFAQTPIFLSYTDLVHLDANAFDLLVTNAGQTGFNPFTNTAGLVFPKGSNTAALFDLGPWVGANSGGGLRLARGGGPPSEYFPGTITGNLPSPYTARFKNFRIERGVTTSDDYLNWPAQDGAPVDGSGAPALQGDLMTWSVYNDVEPAVHKGAAEFGPATTPLGIEVRQSTFSYAAPGLASGIAFARFEMTNHGAAAYDSAYATIWVDSDVGVDVDDLAGCDRSLELGFVYNGTPTDERYGTTPPAFGLALIQGPGLGLDGQPLHMTSFNTYDRGAGPTLRNPAASYVWMKGYDPTGAPMHQGGVPSGPVTKFRYDGDPVAGTGWLDPTLADKRFGVSAGPFHMEPGETRTYVAALLVGQGTSNLNSITRMKALVPVARYIAASGYELLPYVVAPADVEGAEGTPITFHVDAMDLDGDPLTSLTAGFAGLPLGNDAAFDPDPGNGGGTFRWTPAYDHAGTWTVHFTAGNDRSATFATTIHVANTNRAPVAAAGGPYSGVAGAAVSMSGAASSDPDGQSITYAWTFGDGDAGTGASIGHTYLTGGTFDVDLTVSDGTLSDDDATTSTIEAAILARAYAFGNKTTVKLASSRPAHCFQLEPIGASFALVDIDPASIELHATGTGSVDRIPASADKNQPVVDRDGNGISELTVCFAKSDLRRLFDALPPGQQDVAVTIEGAIQSGVRFRAPLTLHVISSGALAASVAPNPLNPEGTLTFRTARAGEVRVSLYDVHGRLVRRVHEGSLGPGYHDFTVDSRDQDGRRLPSGIYFVRIASPEGEAEGRIAIVK